MSHEIELKLVLPPRALAALRRHPLVAAAQPVGSASTLTNTYYDTPDLALRRNGIGLRTRKAGRRWLQTVKAAARSAGGLASRPEWEVPYHGSFDFSTVDNDEIRRKLDKHADAIVPLFTTRFRRETRRHLDGEVEILLMIDRGTVEAERPGLADEPAKLHSEPICELELELVRGRPADLFALACKLAEDLPLAPSDISKAERGYRLRAGSTLEPRRAGPSPLSAELSPVEAFVRLAEDCLAQWQANALGASQSHNPEFIHQLRVALRRLRSALRLFAPALPAEFVEEWSPRLRDAAAELGEARDLDVLHDEVLAPALAATDGSADVAKLDAQLAALRKAARSHVAERLARAGHGRLILQFGAALHALPSNLLIDAARLPTFAALCLDQVRKRARRRHGAAVAAIGNTPGARSPAELHRLRIAFKQLRYGVEFFAPLLPGAATRDYVRLLTKVQNTLGFLNDVDVARHRLAELAAADPSLTAAVAYVCGYHAARCVALNRAAPDLARELLWGDTPWKSLRKRRSDEPRG